jgi:AcrR family transcriptional regulator
MQIAAREGLAGLTIGRLARSLGMSKSGLFAHFRSKRMLEIDTIHEARKLFNNQVLSPALLANQGVDRLWVLCTSWLAHIELKVFPGGYFFTGAFFECAQRSGAIEEQFSLMAREWWDTLNHAVKKAQQNKEINSSTDARQISFDLNGILIATYWVYLVEKDDKAFGEARTAILAKLKELATAQVPANAFKSESAWNDYLKTKRKDKPRRVFPRLGLGTKAQPSNLAPSIPTPMNQPQTTQLPKKSKSPFRNLAVWRKN